MSAADWRKAMNSGAGAHAWPRLARDGGPAAGRAPRQPGDPGRAAPAPAWLAWLARPAGVAHVAVLLAAVLYPWVAPPFFTFQIGAQALALGLIALSLSFLAGYGGMVSLAQMTVAGLAGYG